MNELEKLEDWLRSAFHYEWLGSAFKTMRFQIFWMKWLFSMNTFTDLLGRENKENVLRVMMALFLVFVCHSSGKQARDL